MKTFSPSFTTNTHLRLLLPPICRFNSSWPTQSSIALLRSSFCNSISLSSNFKPYRLLVFSAPSSSQSTSEGSSEELDGVKNEGAEIEWRVEVGNPRLSIPSMGKLSLSDQAFFLLVFIACTTSVAFISLVAAAVPTLYAMGRAATALSKLADTAREELPSTMAAVRLSGMEISDLTLELSDLSQEISDGVTKSTQAVQAAEAGIRQIGVLARQQTMSMIQERASLPIISLQPVVVGAAKKTSRVVGRATKSLMNMISGGNNSEAQEEEEEDDSRVATTDS
ncbi:hypothetical protein F8388_009424 [Cannabis sativa]|uniref:Uncharacterized protein n=1 Tax=Cannabis sativa TaxID=3483 RepID=A0A7J6EID4_CANSA|nr:hypothetical protein F8388_009424 [Cannabis sativa]KAF4387135.1 hypothetical protein G4B88_024707 [Cannabis sativa]